MKDVLDYYHEAIYDFLYEIIAPLNWQELNQNLLVEQKRLRHPADTMPILACMTLGGDGEIAIPSAAAWILYTVTGRIFDDVQSQDLNSSSWLKGGVTRAMNMGLSLLSLAHASLLHIKTEPASIQKIAEQCSYTFAAAAWAQNQRKHITGIISEETYFDITFKRTANFMATAMWSGAYLSKPNQSPAYLDAIYRYGLFLGVMSQIEDDCRDLEQDIRQGVFTLPVLYAMSKTDHPQYSVLASWLESGLFQDAETIAHVVTQMGGVREAIKLAQLYQKQALESLSLIPDNPAKEHLSVYISPV